MYAFWVVVSVDVDFARLGRWCLDTHWFSVDHKEFLVVVRGRMNRIQRDFLRGVGFSMSDRRTLEMLNLGFREKSFLLILVFSSVVQLA